MSLKRIYLCDVNDHVFSGSTLFLFVIIFSYKKFKGNLSKKGNNELTIKQSETGTGIPKPAKKQEIVSNKKPELKKDEKQWKTPIGIQNKSKISNTDLSKNKNSLQEKKDASPSKSPKTFGKKEKMPEIVNNTKPQQTRTEIKTKIENESTRPLKNNMIVQEKENVSPKTLLREENSPNISVGPTANKLNQNVSERLTETNRYGMKD